MRNYWKDEKLVKERKRFQEEYGYEEFEGCIRCVTEKCRREGRTFTMSWELFPRAKCAAHPHYNVLRSLLSRRRR